MFETSEEIKPFSTAFMSILGSWFHIPVLLSDSKTLNVVVSFFSLLNVDAALEPSACFICNPINLTVS